MRHVVHTAALLALLATAQVAHAGEPAAAARYEAWRGGAAFTGLKSLHTSGALSASGLSGTLETWSAGPGQVRQDVDLGVFKERKIVAGDQGWTTSMSGQAQKLSPADRADFLADTSLLAPGALHGAPLAEGPSEPCEAVACDVVTVTRETGAYDYLIARPDGRLVAVRSHVKGRNKTTRFSDWRLVDGVRVPFKQEETGEAASDASTTVLRVAEVNPALAASVFAPPAAVKTAVYDVGQSSSGWLPFELYNGTRLYIPAVVNGRKVAILFDTGATSSVLDRGFAKSVGITVEGEMTAGGVAAVSTAAIAHGVNIRLGALTLTDLTAVAIDTGPIEQQLGHPTPVFLGAEVVRDCIVDIDFQGRRIAFRDPEGFVPPAGAQPIRSTVEGEQQILDALLEGRPVRLEFDLGNGGPLLLYPRFWEQPGLMGARRTSTTWSGGFGGMAENKVAIMRDLVIGGASFSRVPAELGGANSRTSQTGRLDGNIGMPVFKRGHLIIDLPHERIFLVPPVDTVTPFEVDHSGLKLQPDPAGFKVAHVAKASPAERAGFKAGEVIVTVDGKPTLGQALGEAAKWRTGPAGQIHVLALAGGEKRSLELADYY